MGLRYEGTPHLRVIAVMKEVRGGIHGDNLLGSMEIIINTWKVCFIEPFRSSFFLRSGKFTTRSHAY